MDICILTGKKTHKLESNFAPIAILNRIKYVMHYLRSIYYYLHSTKSRRSLTVECCQKFAKTVQAQIFSTGLRSEIQKRLIENSNMLNVKPNFCFV